VKIIFFQIITGNLALECGFFDLLTSRGNIYEESTFSLFENPQKGLKRVINFVTDDHRIERKEFFDKLDTLCIIDQKTMEVEPRQ